MAFALDPEIAAALAPLAEQMAGADPAPAGDVAARRASFGPLVTTLLGAFRGGEAVAASDHACVGADGADVALRLFTPPSPSGGLVVWAHGGGLILGSVDAYEPLLGGLAAEAGTSVLAVEYRLAPEHPHPTPVQDVHAAVRWASQNAAGLGLDPGRIAVAGDSGGGAVAAGAAILARDRGGPAIARQILMYPMLDDRNVTPPAVGPSFALWTHDDNATGWGALLGSAAGGPNVSPYAAPARAVDLSDLPPAWITVGDLDIFCDEDVDYGRRLAAAGVGIELHVVPGAPHAFDYLAPDAAASRRVRADLVRVISGL